MITGGAVIFLTLVFGGLPILFVYLLGGVPAAVTGLCSGLAARAGKVWFYLATATIAGGAVSALSLGPKRILDATGGRMGMAGAVAGLICALLTLRLAGLSLQIPASVNDAVRRWDATTVLLVVLGGVCMTMVVLNALMLLALL
ncbi:hypothetical protein [Brevundimonas sp. UBA7534]|jgi:hypothetical protein|uniref:hypothetical protein n=1 Tax=Brevundimonas sp. UBA7534 TaxID=1946138 RepID=UPI00191671FD|nr:hypothetical protein [Brevundimonas sp. UBA7534]